MGKTVRTLLIDANNIAMRAIKASEARLHLSVELEDGEVNTGPLLLFANMVSKYIRQEEPDRVLACWDGGKSSHRLAIFEHYKAARPDATEEKDHTPFALCKEFLSLAGIHHLEVPGVEADDLIAACWRKKGNDDRLVILSGDKDFLQLLDGWTEQIRPGTGDNEVWTTNRVRTELGCKPEHLPYVMALTGDSGDGVPGIPGFGAKTACKALAQYDWDLDALLEHAPDDPKWSKKLAFQRDAVRRNLALVDLRRPLDPEPCIPDPPPFAPTDPTSLLYHDLVDWMGKYKLESIQHRLITDTLWRD